MPRKFIKRFLPDPTKIQQSKSLGVLAKHLGEPSLWVLTRASVANAFSIGLFVAFIPMPLQMLVAAALAILFRANLPISVGLVWITNPLTMPAIFYACYKLGSLFIGSPSAEVISESTLEWIMLNLNQVWPPFLLGCFLAGSFFAVAGNIGIRLLWRLQVSLSWNKRNRLRRLNEKQSEEEKD